MGARPTRAGGQQVRANRHCGWPTASAVGAVGVGATAVYEYNGYEYYRYRLTGGAVH